MLLLDLPNDALAALLQWLTPRDLAAAALACRRLLEVAGQDLLWRPHCRRWLARQPVEAGLGAATVADLRQCLGCSSDRRLYQVLHELGAWPVGVWYASGGSRFHPRGQLLVVEQQGRTLVASMLSAGIVPGPTVNQETLWELDDWFLIHLRGGGGGDAVELYWELPGDGSDSLSITEDCIQVGESRPEGGGPAQWLPGLLSGGLVAAPSSHQPGVRFSRLPLLPPSPQQPGEATPAAEPAGPGPAVVGAATTLEGAAILQQLEGVYTACYGPHGMEVLILRMAGSGDPPPPHCDIVGPRLQGLKVTGDPNVPALRYSFVADAAQCRLGPFVPQDDPFPQDGFARPVLSIFQSAMVMVHLTARPVRARISAVGQINQLPGVWDPEWVAATLIVYEEGYPVAFTVIFEDEGEEVRHAMDFWRLAVPLPAPFDPASAGLEESELSE